MPKSSSQLATPSAPASSHDPRRQGWNLQWRKSSELADASPSTPAANVLRSAPQPASTAQVAPPTDVFDEPPATLRKVGHSIELSPAPVTRAAWAQPQLGMPSTAPVADEEPNRFAAPVPAEEDSVDFFNDPFGDDAPERRPAQPEAARSSESLLLPPGSPQNAPAAAQPLNELRQPSGAGASLIPPLDSSAAPAYQPTPAAPLRQSPQPQSPQPQRSGPSLRDMLRNERPENGNGSERDEIASPSDREGQFNNPFDRRDAADRPAETEPEQAIDEPRRAYGVPEDDLADAGGISCEDFRQRIAAQSIRDVSLDISPPFRPDVIEEAEFQKLKSRFDDKQPSRQWRSIAGQPLGTGRLVDLAYEKVIIKTDEGATRELPINQLSEGDLGYISQNWGLPSECLIEQVAYQPRAWTPTTMTWKASNLCHKPLYFEEVNLERYGHTAGPFLQPLVSSAHFFANIAVLPYKMGIHPPGECQYALGYYRPGNCAPWIVPPVPISLRGGLTQAAAMTGTFLLVP